MSLGGRVPARVGDLVSVAPLRPVVRLADLDDGRLAPELGVAFVLTEDAAHALGTLFRDIRAGRGRGYFLEGHYGAGKSHLMAVVHGLLTGMFAPQGIGAALARPERGADPVPDLALPAARPLPVAVSLVEHAAREPLEGVVLAACRAAVGDQAASGGGRRAAFEALDLAVRARGRTGIVLCIDELTEFLRSKADARAFAEDVRFLQFLGEWAQTAPAWIVLGIQEAVERTGELPAAVFGGVRDRYPVRFRLGAQHVRGLVERRLIRLRPGAEEELVRLAARLRHVFGELACGEAELCRLYPVHPLTIELLDRLRPLVAERRGVLDFVASRLAGDPARRIPSWLEQPVERLLGPDALIDHFRDRVRERPETAPLVTVVLDYFERELDRLFPEAETAGAALRLGKLLIAGALCPTPVGFTVADMTGALLHPLTSLEPALNVEFIGGIAQRLAERGAHVRAVQPGAAGGPVRYFCDLRADLGPVLEARLRRWREELAAGDRRVWEALLPWCDDPRLPLQRLAAKPLGPWEVTWRRTTRQAAVWLVDLQALAPDALREAARRLELEETDALVLLGAGWPQDVEPLRRRWREVLAPAAHAVHPRAAVLCWLPRAPGTAAGALRDLAAAALVGQDLDTPAGETEQRLQRHLRVSEGERRRQAAELSRDLFAEGEVLDADGQVASPSALGPLPFSALLEHLLDAPLQRRFPLAPELPARLDALPPDAPALLARVLRGEGGGGPEVLALVARGLAPLQLCRRDARGWSLREDAAGGPHAAQFVAALRGRTPAQPLPLPSLYLRLRKGPSGLVRPLFTLLCLALARCGVVSAVQDGRRVPPEQITPERLEQIGGLCPGALVPQHLRSVAPRLPFAPAGLEARPWTHGLQRELWDLACAWRRHWAERLPALRAELARVGEYPVLGGVLSGERQRSLELLEGLLAAIAVSLPAERGLTRLLAAAEADPGALGAALTAAQLDAFVRERLDAYLQMREYVGAEAFAPPPELAAAVSALRGRLGDAEGAMGSGFAAMRQAFDTLREAYAQAYQRAHAAVGEGLPAALAAVTASGAYRLVQLRGGPDAEALAADLQQVAAAGCAQTPGALADRLRRWPECTCGLRLGTTPAPTAAVGERCAFLAAEFLRALQAPGCAAALRRAAAEGGTGCGPAVERLLALAPAGEGSCAAALECLEVLGEAIWRPAWAGRPEVRRLAALADRLVGAVWQADALLGAVRAWVGAPPAGAGVRVLGLEAGAGDEPARRQRATAAVEALEAVADRPPSDPPGWEAAWLGSGPCWARRLEEAEAAGVGEAVLQPLRRRGREAALRLDRAFGSALRAFAAVPGWERAGLEPVGVALDRAGREVGGEARVYAFCVDALRADLHEAVLDLVAAWGLRLRPLERGIVWAVAPTLTAAQFQAWSARGWSVEVVPQGRETTAAARADGRAALARVAWGPRRPVCKWDFLDKGLHGATDDLGAFAAGFRLRASRLLLPVLEAVGAGDRVVLFADHGFRLETDAGGAMAYAHGGESPDEVLVPYCVLGAG